MLGNNALKGSAPVWQHSMPRWSPVYRNRLGATVLLILVTCWLWLSPTGAPSGALEASTTDLSALRLPEHKYAYVTFLSAPPQPTENDGDDIYFVATRILAYSLLHDPKTRTETSTPFLVLVTEEVAESKRSRLEMDGATVIPVGKLSFDWIHPAHERWRDMFSKFFLFTLTQYERVLYFDSDMLIVQRMDGIFQDPAAELRKTRVNRKNSPPEEGPQPSDYVYAGVTGQGGPKHPFPPRSGSYCNGGFFLTRPSKELFQHYLTVAENAEGKFNSNYSEQGLWNYVHRRRGNMPWQQLNSTWNVNWAVMKDLEMGVKSLHTRWWEPGQELKEVGMALKRKMEDSAMVRDTANGLQ